MGERCNISQPYYVGMTTQTLQKRLKQHCYTGAIKQHLKQDHNIEATKELLFNNCIIITSTSDQIKLPIYEALHILQSGPSINKQFDSFTRQLSLFSYLPNNECL